MFRSMKLSLGLAAALVLGSVVTLSAPRSAHAVTPYWQSYLVSVEFRSPGGRSDWTHTFQRTYEVTVYTDGTYGWGGFDSAYAWAVANKYSVNLLKVTPYRAQKPDRR